MDVESLGDEILVFDAHWDIRRDGSLISLPRFLNELISLKFQSKLPEHHGKLCPRRWRQRSQHAHVAQVEISKGIAGVEIAHVARSRHGGKLIDRLVMRTNRGRKLIETGLLIWTKRGPELTNVLMVIKLIVHDEY